MPAMLLAMDSQTDQVPPILAVKRIEPAQLWHFPDFREIWRYREMMFMFIWRDLSTRYRHTLVGASWVVISPIITMVIFSIFFGGLLKVPSNGIPYPIFSYAGLLPWTLFSGGASRVGSSILANGYLINKIYFPRLIIPISSLLFNLVDFAVSFIILLGMMVVYGYAPTLNIIFSPVLLLLALLAAFAIGIWFAALSVIFRDASQILGFFMSIMLYATPVIYPSSLLTEPWLTLYKLNPMVGVVDGFRWALLGTSVSLDITAILMSTTVTVIALFSGIFYFGYAEQFFSDVI